MATPIAQVKQSDNRLDLFAREELGAYDDERRADLIFWNIDYFVERRTFWLGPGDFMALGPPEPGTARRLVVNGRYLVVNGRRLVVD